MNYLTWCEQARYLPLATPGDELKSANRVKVCTLPDNSQILLKVIRPDVVYIPRIKILGEVAYSLLDYHLDPEERITPNVCPISQDRLWRQFIQGLPGEIWRGNLYKETESLEAADLRIVDQILSSTSAQRIALLDFIFLCQDRSARNWIVDKEGKFWAIDNGMLWPYKGRYADKETASTGKVDHLNPPMEALVSTEIGFLIGLFSSLYAGRPINDGLLEWLYQVDWQQYLHRLNALIGVLGYPFSIVNDWRFTMLEVRANWLLRKRRFPTTAEAFGEWQQLIDRPEMFFIREWQSSVDRTKIVEDIWKIEWETENSDTR